jgi:hypothetical protein
MYEFRVNGSQWAEIREPKIIQALGFFGATSARMDTPQGLVEFRKIR